MKQIRVSIPLDKVKVIQEIFDGLPLVYEIEIHQSRASFISCVENNMTAMIIEELKGVGVGTVYGSLTISPVDIELNSETSRTKGEKTPMRENPFKGKGISMDEMISNIGSLALLNPTFVILCVLAGFLAAFGLLADNVVIIIASMIIAPLLGPIAMTVLGTLLPDNPYRIRAIITEIVGLGICISIGMLVGALSPKLVPGNLVPAIQSRTSPGFGDIVFAVISGLAAGIFIVRGESTNIVGVAVAASLCPPAANVGLLLSNALFMEALGSLMLLLLNVITIYFTCAIIFWISQTFVRGGTISSRQYRKITKRYYAQIVVAIVVLVAIIVMIVALGAG